MFLYKQYCYETNTQAANTIKSELVYLNQYPITDVVFIAGQSFDLTYLDGVTPIVTSIELPVCTKVGFDNSYTGISTSDAVEYSWMVVAVLVTAASIKYLRRTL